MPAITDIVAGTPLWVFAVAVLLLVLGLRQCRTRTVRPGLIVGIALAMVGLSIWGVAGTFGAHAVPLLAWAAGFGLTAFGFGRWLLPATIRRAGPRDRRVEVSGSVVPLVTMFGIFLVKYGLGVALALHWSGLAEPWVGGVAGLALGLAAGAFAVRALAIWRAAQPQPGPGLLAG